MPKSDSEALRSLAWPTYFVAFLLVVTPALDFVTNVWPLRPGEVGWRYGAEGLLAGFLLTPLIGVMIAFGAAIALRHLLVMRILSFVNIAVAAFLLLLIALFALDVLQVRATVPEEARGMFQTGAVKAAVKHLTVAVALSWLGIVGIRVTRSRGKSQGRRTMDDDVQLVRSEGAAPPA